MPAEQQATSKEGEGRPTSQADRTEVEALNLKGVNLAEEDTTLELGTFTHLENWVPERILAIQKKRGSFALNPGGLNLILTEDSNFLTTESGNPLITEV